MSNTATKKTASENGPRWGQRARDWAEIQEATARPAYEAVLHRMNVGPDTAHLDAGCGSGMAASMAGALGARVHGIDASEALLAIAAERCPDGEFHQTDLEEIPFDDNSFDLVTGFNAFQYAGNPRAALQEAGRVCRPDGNIVIVTWAPPEGMEAASVLAALKPFMPPPPPGAKPGGPFALSDETVLRGFASDAGLTPDHVFDVESPWTYPDLDTALRGIISAGVARLAIERAGEEAVTNAHIEALEPFRQEDGSYKIGSALRCLVALP